METSCSWYTDMPLALSLAAVAVMAWAVAIALVSMVYYNVKDEIHKRRKE